MVERVSLEMAEGSDGRSARLQLALFDAGKATLRFLDQPAEPRSSVAEVLQRNNCVAGTNGGYFDPDHGLIGMLRSRGRTVAPWRKARLLSGVIAVSPGKVELLRLGKAPARPKWIEARQSGPFLVERGRPVAGLEKTRRARRTFIATNNKRGVALGYCSGVTLAELAEILAALDGREFAVERALNLDGGSSSAFWSTSAEGEPFSISGYKMVRDVVGIVEK